MIEVDEVVKHYGSHVAVRGVSFQAGRGEVLGLLGPNGAGKSTLMRVLVGLIAPTSGAARVAGFDVQTQGTDVRRRLGYLPENVGLYTEMRVDEYLRYRASAKGMPGPVARPAVDRVLARCDLLDVRTRIVDQLSKGYRQRVALAATLLHDPDVLILDEPTVGLDPLQMREIRALVRELGADRTVLFSTHILAEAEAVCDRVVIIDRGRKLADGDPRALTAKMGAQDLTVEVLGPEEAALTALATLIDAEVTVVARGVVLRLAVQMPGVEDPERRARVARALTDAGCTVTELSLSRTSLDEAFARLTAAAPEDDAAAPTEAR